MNSTSYFLLALILTALTLSFSARPERSGPLNAHLKSAKPKHIGGNTGGPGGFFGPGGGFGIPDLGNGWGNGVVGGGYGSGYGGPSGGYAKGGVVKPSVVCKEKGPCYKKTVTCPAKCFTSYSRSGKNYGTGGGGGSCTIDCKKKCIAHC